VFDAVGVRVMDLPLTAEKVFAALQAKRGGRSET
jgi:CO/xanthine dehydrogenase Mo-binding subunit